MKNLTIVIVLIIIIVLILVIKITRNQSLDNQHPCSEKDVAKLIINDIVVTKYITDFGDNPNPTNERCFFFLGDEDNVTMSQRFGVRWSMVSPIGKEGGFIIAWNDNIAIVESGKSTWFDEYHQYRFGLGNEASLPCYMHDSKELNTESKIELGIRAVSFWQPAQNIDWSKTADTIRVTWNTLPKVDTYVVSAKIERLQVLDPLGEMEIFPVTYAYHGGIADGNHMDIELPEYYFDNSDIMSEYGLVTSVRVFGFRSCNLGPLSTSQVDLTHI